MSTPALRLKSSPARCSDVPVPPLAYAMLPGLAFAAAMSSAVVLMPVLGCTTSTSGPRATIEIGLNSAIVYGTLSKMNGFTANGMPGSSTV